MPDNEEKKGGQAGKSDIVEQVSTNKHKPSLVFTDRDTGIYKQTEVKFPDGHIIVLPFAIENGRLSFDGSFIMEPIKGENPWAYLAGLERYCVGFLGRLGEVGVRPWTSKELTDTLNGWQRDKAIEAGEGDAQHFFFKYNYKMANLNNKKLECAIELMAKEVENAWRSIRSAIRSFEHQRWAKMLYDLTQYGVYMERAQVRLHEPKAKKGKVFRPSQGDATRKAKAKKRRELTIKCIKKYPYDEKVYSKEGWSKDLAKKLNAGHRKKLGKFSWRFVFDISNEPTSPEVTPPES